MPEPDAGQSSGFSDMTVRAFVAATATQQPAPSGGVVAAVTLASAAALVAMGARFAGGRTAALAGEAEALATRALELAEEDARAYGAVLEALRLPQGTTARTESLAGALAAAADVPLEVLAAGCRVTGLGVRVARASAHDLLGDVATGVLLADAAGRASERLVAINLDHGAPDGGRGERSRRLVAVLDATLHEWSEL